MAPDRGKMGERHEEFLAALNGGRKTKASGSQWTDQADGRGNELTDPFAFAWDGKSTRGESIAVSRGMIIKIREQAASERPMIGLRFYGSDDLRQVDEDWIAVTAADWAEVLAAAREVEQARDAMRRVAEADAMLGFARTMQKPEQPGPSGWYRDTPDYTHTDPGPQAMIVPPPLHGAYPPDLPVPPSEMWPCLVVDARHEPGDGPGTRIVNKGYQVNWDGRVTEFDVHSVRYDMGLGHVTLYVNDIVVRSGQLYVDKALRTTVGGRRNLIAQ